MKTNMGVKELVLIVTVLFSFSPPSSFASVSKNLVSENAHENKGDNGMTDDNISTVGGGSRIINRSKYTTVVRGGGGGGGGGGHSGGSGSQSNSSPQGGNEGNGVVPVYAAGAAGQRKNHKGGASTCSPYRKGEFGILIAISSASLLLDIRM